MSQASIRVLLVDENPADQDRISALLKLVGRPTELAIAATFEEGLQQLRGGSFDVCLVDERLGAQEGRDLIAQATADGCTCPFVLLSGKGCGELDHHASESGAVGCLDKNDLRTETLCRTVSLAADAQEMHGVRRRDGIIQRLEWLSDDRPVPHTAEAYAPRAPQSDWILEYATRYAEILDQAMERRVYRVEPQISDALRKMAEDLATVRAGPRDVINIHCQAIGQRRSGLPVRKALAYVEEANMMALQLMGYLVACYRNYATACYCHPAFRASSDAAAEVVSHG